MNNRWSCFTHFVSNAQRSFCHSQPDTAARRPASRRNRAATSTADATAIRRSARFDDEPPVYKAKGLQLGTVIARGVERFVYTYDYGDNWRHDVIVEEVRDGDPDMEYPAFVDGARRCPPEDAGGPDGFMDFLEAVLDPAHEQHRDMVRWYGGPFDPIGLDEERARFGMENMARRRRGPLASHRTGSRRPKR